MRIIHRYARRLIAWASQPSDEEIARQAEEAKLARRRRLSRNVRNALLRENRYPEWIGLNAEDAANLIEDVRAIGAADPIISQEMVDRLVAFLQPCTFVAPPKHSTIQNRELI